MPAPLPIFNDGCKPGCSCKDARSRLAPASAAGFQGDHASDAPGLGASPLPPAGSAETGTAKAPSRVGTCDATMMSPSACGDASRPASEARSPEDFPAAVASAPPTPTDRGASFHVEPGRRETGTTAPAASPAAAAGDSASFHVEHDRQLATLGSLVASIAHEINNILTPIASYADLARMHPADEELTAKALQRAASGAREASEIATAILSLATPERGDAPAHCDDLREIIHRARLCLGSEPARLGVRVLWDAPQGLAPAMPAVALQHVLVNLLINALRASKRGGTIEVSAAAVGAVGAVGAGEAGGEDGSTWNLAEVTVRDAGEGIPEQQRGAIFRDFESGCGSTGLGLAICRRLLEKWGGSIRLVETGTGGTVFAVTAPIAADNQQQAA